MPEAGESRPSFSYWLISALLLLWGILSILIYAALLFETPEQYAAGVENAAHRQAYADYLANIPIWAITLGASVGVARLFGAVGLFLRRAWALPLYILSLILFLSVLCRAFVFANAGEAMSARHIAVEAGFVAFSLFAICFAYRHKATGVLR